MHMTCLIYHFLEAALFWDVWPLSNFLSSLLADSVVFISANEKRLQNQVYKQIKS